MNSNNSINQIKPDSQSWAIAGISLIGLLFFNYIAVSELEKIRKELKISALEEDYYSTSEADKSIVSNISNAVKPKGLATYVSESKNTIKLNLLKEIEFNLQRSDINTAIEILEKFDKTISPKNSDTSELLKPHLQNIAVFMDKKLKISEEKSKVLIAHEEIKISYQNIKNELLTFLGLTEETDKGDSLLFYDSGLLQSLPQLKAFNEPIENIQVFSESLSAAGGKITIEEGADPQQFFQEKISELSDKSFNIMLAHDKNSEKTERLNTENLKAEAKLSSEHSLTLRLLNELALKIAKN